MGVLVENVNAGQPGITSGGNGNVSVTGQGGGSGASNANVGVWLRLNDAIISAGGTGTVTVNGTGGNTNGNGNDGVRLEGTGTKVTSSGGNVNVTGSGGTGGGNSHIGVEILNGTSVTTTGTGAVSVTGTGGGGATSSGFNLGVRVSGVTAAVTAPNGNVQVTGTAGKSQSNDNYGVLLESSLVEAGGGGAASVTGNGSLGNTATSNQNIGILSQIGTVRSLGAGAVTITGTGGTGSNGSAIGMQLLTNSLITSGGGNIQFTGTGGSSTGGLDYGTIIGIGTDILAGGAGLVTVIGTGGTGPTSWGVWVVSGGTTISSTSGAISITGTGGTGSGTSNKGVVIDTGASVTAPAALTVTGTKGAGTTTGILVTGAGTTRSAVGLATLNGPSSSDVTVDTSATANFGALTVNAAGGTVTVLKDSDMAVNTVDGAAITLSSAGNMTDNNGASNNLTGTSAVLTATGGVGTAVDSLESTIASLEGAAGSGFYLDNTAATLTIGGISATVGITAVGAIGLTTTANLVVNETVSSSGAQPVTVSFGQNNLGATATLNAAISGTPAKLIGGTGSDTFQINATGSNLVVIGGGVPALGTDTVTAKIGGLVGYVILTDPGVGTENYVVNVDASSLGTARTFDANNAVSGNQAVSVASAKVLTYNNTANTISALNLLGTGSSDTFNIQYGNPTDFPAAPTSLIPQRVNIVAGSGGTDVANITGSSIADTVDVNFTKARWVTRNAENVTYTGNLETLNVFVQAGDDAVYAKPDTATAINLSGAAPVAPSLPGDFLQLSVVGVTNPVISAPAIPDGQVASSSHKTLTWTSFETVPVPLGLGGTFDFGPTPQQLQTLPAPSKQVVFLPVGPNDLVASNPNGYGWNTAASGFDRVATDPWGTPSGPSSFLLRDGAWGAATPAGGDRNFFVAVAPSQPVQVSLFIGDQYAAWSTMDIYFDATKVGSVTPAAAGQFTRFVANYTPTGAAMTISVRQPLSTTYWVLNGIDARPVSLVAPLSITRGDAALGTVAKLADGLTQDVYDVAFAQPNELLTVSPTFGTLVGVDADPALNGFQVVANGAGQATFTLQRPTGTGNNTINATGAYNQSSTTKLFGGSTASGDFVQTYGLPTVRRLDFDSVSIPPPQPSGTSGLGRPKFMSVRLAMHSAGLVVLPRALIAAALLPTSFVTATSEQPRRRAISTSTWVPRATTT